MTLDCDAAHVAALMAELHRSGLPRSVTLVEALQAFVQAECRPAEVVLPEQDAVSAKTVQELTELQGTVRQLIARLVALQDEHTKLAWAHAYMYSALLKGAKEGTLGLTVTDLAKAHYKVKSLGDV